jgi:hypothetical protein
MPETMAALLGTLVVELIRAQGIRGDEMLGLGKADPYAIITCGAQAKKSLIAKGNNVSTAKNLQLRGPPAASLLDCKQFQSCLYNGFLQIEELAACICHTFGYLQSHKHDSPLFSCLVFS